MMSKLSRESVLHEIDALDHEIRGLSERVKAKDTHSPIEVVADLEELEGSIVLARQLIFFNEMDFRRVELALVELRAMKKGILKALEGASNE